MWASNLDQCQDPADYAYCTCEVYSCGYSQPNRKHISLLYLEEGTAETDCSAGVSWWLYMGGFLEECPWFYTVIEGEYLLEHGYEAFAFGTRANERNDVLWRPGHTGLYIGEGMQAEALRDENHDAGYEGTSPGDQDGGETVVRSLTFDWVTVYRRIQPPTIKELVFMTFIFTSGGQHRGKVFYYDGGHIWHVKNSAQQTILKKSYKNSTGQDLPFFYLEDGDALFALLEGKPLV